MEGCEFGTYMVCTSEMGEYAGFCGCPRGRWLATKLAEWIGENLQEESGFPHKADKRAEPGTGWTHAEPNHILHDHVVDGALDNFSSVEWESGLSGASCIPGVIHLTCLSSAFIPSTPRFATH